MQIRRELHNVPAFAAVVNERALEALQRNPNVESVYEDWRAYACIDESVPYIGADYAWSHTPPYTGAGVTVAIIDTGIDYTHPALGGGFGPGHKVVWGYDFVNGDADPMDDHDHGTHVAGIAASSDSTYRGVAPDADLVALKVLDADGTGWFSDAAAAVDWCIDNKDTYGIRVINMSLGDGGSHQDPDFDCEDRATAQAIRLAFESGILVVAAVGNGGSNLYPEYPGACTYALSVGASYDYTSPDESWSYGGGSCWQQNVELDDQICFSNKGHDLLAPGAHIVSTVQGGTFQDFFGTSMAAPHVSGAAALLFQAGHTDPGEVRAQLWSTAQKNGVITPGWRVDVESAVTLPCDKPELLLAAVDAPETATTGDAISVSVTIRNSGAATAAASTAKVYLSANSIFSATSSVDTLLTTVEVPALGVGEEYSTSVPALLPTQWVDGAYYVGLVADTGKTVAEWNEFNNTGYDAAPINITGIVLGQEMPIATDPDPQTPLNQASPDVSGNYVVWRSTDYIGPNADTDGEAQIRMMDLTDWAENRVDQDIAESPRIQPTVGGDWIVWSDGRHEEQESVPWALYKRQIGDNEQRITPPTVERALLASVNGDWLVYTDTTDTPVELILHHLPTGTEQTISNSLGVADIEYPYVVYGCSCFYGGDIYIYDVSSGETYLLGRHTPGMFGFDRPRISGNWVVWLRDFGRSGGEVTLYDLSVDSDEDGVPNWKDDDRPDPDPAGRVICEDMGWGSYGNARYAYPYVDISGHRVVWNGYRENSLGINEDIYLYDILLDQTFRLTDSGAVQTRPRIDGRRVVYQDFRAGNWDVYMFELDEDRPATLRVSPSVVENSCDDGTSTPFDDSVEVENLGGGSVSWTASSDAAWLSIDVNSGTTPATVTLTTNPTGLTPDVHTGHVTFDAGPLVLASPQDVTVHLTVRDITPPDTRIIGHPSELTTSTSASFYWTGTDDVGGLTYSRRLDSGEWSSWSSYSSVTFSDVSDGLHTFEVKAKDEAGNIDPTPAAWTWRVDPHAPTTPTNPSPADDATAVVLPGTLTWDPCTDQDEDAVTYDVYFEANDSTPDVLVSEGQTATSFAVTSAEYNTGYYWKVVARDEHGAGTSGPIWSFSTAEHTFAVFASADPSTVGSGGTTSLSANYSDSWGHGIASWLWDDDGAGGSFSPSDTAQNPSYTAPANTTDSNLIVTLTVNATCDGAPSESDSDSVDLTVQPAQTYPAPQILLEVHPNERAPGPGSVLMIGTAPWQASMTGPGGVYEWKKYQFEASGDLWVQVCGQAWSASQNSPVGADKIRVDFDGVKLTDWWGIQSGPAGGPQWDGNVDRGKRLTLEFLVPGVSPGLHTLKVNADETPVLWWVRVTELGAAD